MKLKLRQNKQTLDKGQDSRLASYLLPLLVSLGSGICMGLTVAPVSAWFLAWIALAPLWVIIVKSSSLYGAAFLERRIIPKRCLRNALLPYSLLWGIGYHGVAIWWITGIHPMTWMGVPWLASLAIAIFCLTFLALWGAALVVVWAVTTAWLIHTTNVMTRVLIGVGLWCGLESLWSRGALWWTTLAYTQSPHNVAILHLGQLSGTTTITAAIVAVNILLAEVWLNRQHKKIYISLAVGLLASLHLIGWQLSNQPLTQSAQTALKVGIIQGNVPNEIKLYSDGISRAIARYTSGYQTLADQGVDAVLTPEGALPFRWDDVERTSFYAAVKENGVTAWVGAFGQQGRSITNSLFTLTANGEVFSRYNKYKLVPLGEYIPFEQFLGGLIDRLSPLDAHLVAGASNQILDTPFGRAIAAICYESAFGEHFRRQTAAGGQFILSAANNAHYSPAMPAQHHAQDVMRAIESDRWVVRATNTGYSGIIDPHGKIEWISKLNTYQLHAATIYRRETKTLYVRSGDWLMPLLLGLGVVFKIQHQTSK